MERSSQRPIRRGRTRLGAAVAVVGLLAAACGGDDDDDSEATAGATAEMTADDTSADDTSDTSEVASDDTSAEASGDDATEQADDDTAGEASADEGTATETADDDGATDGDGEEPTDAEGKVTDYVAYTGGTDGPADDSLEPIRLGYVNQDGGAIVVSSTHVEGVRAGVSHINEHLGGIGGHPLELVECYIANTEEEGQQCGQDFANDDSLAAIISGPVVTGSQAFYAALDGSKIVIHGISVSPVDLVQPNVAALNGGAAYVLAPFGTFGVEVLGAESAALVYSEETQSSAAAGQAAAFEALGVPIEVVGYSQGTPDLTVPLLAAGAPDADIVMPVIASAECVQFAEAQRQLGIPDEKVLASPVCLTPATAEGLGDFPNWNYGVTTSLGIDPSDPAIPPYLDVLAEQGLEDLIPDPWTLAAFGQTLTVAQWMNNLGADDISTEGLLDEMANFTGPLALGAPVLDCGKYAEAPGVCGDHTQFYRYVSPDFTQASDFVGPPEGWENPS